MNAIRTLAIAAVLAISSIAAQAAPAHVEACVLLEPGFGIDMMQVTKVSLPEDVEAVAFDLESGASVYVVVHTKARAAMLYARVSAQVDKCVAAKAAELRRQQRNAPKSNNGNSL